MAGTAEPELLDKLQIKGQITTIDAMDKQTAIAEKIRNRSADYVLALKGNQGRQHGEVAEYFSDAGFLKRIKEEGNYKKTQEKAHSQIETREYYQTEDIKWLSSRKEWKGRGGIMAKEATLQVRMDADLKEKAESLYRDMGTSFAEAVRIFAKQSVQENTRKFY